ncbi:hypothetical protein Zmor_021985 [Zophobas morio]|uniref:Uncharacterized protein n=1 Tax=Zophobas morio TaxID=2755281 RepID=A0AA38MBF6_9CUCU|nr:hypothetical protein Zmor_021985 [Zophobas morio]
MDADTVSVKRNHLHDLKEIQKTWQNVENNIKTIGFGDGLSFGRNSTFQEYFDQGFIEGFRAAYAVGEFNGSSFCELTQNKKEHLEKHPVNAKTAWCQLCENKELFNRSIAEVVAQQTEINDRNLKQLQDGI